MIVGHLDMTGTVAYITRILAEHRINVATLKLFREDKGKNAFTVIESDSFISDEIKEEIIQSSMQYSRIRERVCFLRFLESIMDDNRTVFKYNKKENAFSLIQADFLLKNAVENRNIFLFLAKSDNDFYFCRSFSPNRR